MRTLAATMATITTLTFALFGYALVTHGSPGGPGTQAVSR